MSLQILCDAFATLCDSKAAIHPALPRLRCQQTAYCPAQLASRPHRSQLTPPKSLPSFMSEHRAHLMMHLPLFNGG